MNVNDNSNKNRNEFANPDKGRKCIYSPSDTTVYLSASRFLKEKINQENCNQNGQGNTSDASYGSYDSSDDSINPHLDSSGSDENNKVESIISEIHKMTYGKERTRRSHEDEP